MNHLDIELQKCKKDLDMNKSGTTELIEKSNFNFNFVLFTLIAANFPVIIFLLIE